MQITSNTTGMPAALTVAADKEGRDYCVVVVKGTFVVDCDGRVKPAEQHQPLVFADVHYGDPANTSIKYECDFARYKPRADVLVNGHACSPGGVPVEELEVSLEIDGVLKRVRVVGDRRWEPGAFGFSPSRPVPFVNMPLVYERAFGGSDQSHASPSRHGSELRNLVGVGYHSNSAPKAIEGAPLPNLEDPGRPIRGWSDTPPPAGFGSLGRGWQPRIRYAGTYDQKWLEERFPFLPVDFDDRYFCSAPEDQQTPHMKAGQRVRCTNMTPHGDFVFVVPEIAFPVTYRFRDREERADPLLDTMLLEPDRGRVMLTWRSSVLVGRKLHALRGVLVGYEPRRGPAGKPRLESLSDLIAWEKRSAASRSAQRG